MDKIGISMVIGAALAGSFHSTLGAAESKVDKLGAALRTASRRDKADANLAAARGELSDLDGQLAATAKRLGELRSSMAVGAPTRKMAKELKQVTSEYNTLYAATERARGKVKSAEDAHRGAARAADEQAAKLGRLGRSLEDVRVRHEKLGAAVRAHRAAQERQASARGGLFDAIAIGAAVKGLVGGATTFQSTLTDIAITADLPREKIQAIGRELAIIAQRTGQTRESLAEAFKVLVAAGMAPDVALGSLEAIGKTATASGASVEDVAKTVFSVLDNLKVAPGEALRAMDMLTLAGKQGNFELVDMARTFPQLTASMQRFLRGTEGVATLGAALQIARKGAGSNDDAANNLRNFLDKLAAPDTVKNFAKMGVNIEAHMKEAARRGVNPIEHMLKVIQKLTGGNEFKMGQLFGDMQVKSFLTPMLANMDEYRRIKADVLKANGTVDADANRRMNEDPAYGWSRLGDSLIRLRDSAIGPLLPPLIRLTDTVVAVLTPVAEFAQRNETLVSVIGTTIGFFVTGRVAVLGLGYAFAVVGTGIKALGVAFAANPIGLVLTGIALAAAVVYANWDKIGPMLGETWDWMRSKADELVAWFETIPDRMEQIGLDLALGLSNGIRNAWQSVKDSAVGMADGAVDSVKDFLGIRSPSRVFAGIGEFMGQGLAMGIDRSEGGVLSRMGQMAGRLAAVPLAAGAFALSGMSPAGAAVGAAAPGITINITVNGPADADDIATRVRAELEEYFRDASLARNARTFD